MKMRRAGLGFLSASLAAALAAGAPATVLAASPEFARTAEEWAVLRDNTLEYEEIPDLIHEYNSTVQNNMVSYDDYRGKDANEIADDYREAAQTLYDSIEWPSEDDSGYAMLYSAAETAQAQARQMEKMADDNVSDGMIIKWQYDQVEASLSSTAQNLMNQYYQLQENLKTAQSGKELAEASLQAVQTQASLGMATNNDVLTAQEAVKTAEAGIISIQSSIQSVKQNLQVMTGWAYNSQPEIAPMPQVDVTRIDSMNPETDLEKALARSADESLLQAIGLSLSAPAYTPNAIMTYKDQKSRERQMRITFLSIGLTTVVLMLLLAFCGKLYMGYLDEKAHKAELESRIASWPVLYTPDQLRNNLADTQKWQVQARTLAKRRIAAALMTELSTITPEAIHITGMRVTFKDVNPGKQEAQRGTKKPSEPEESAVAVLTGSVAGDMLQRESQLAEFLSQLEHSPMVLSLVVEKQQTDTEILSFVATLRLV